MCCCPSSPKKFQKMMNSVEESKMCNGPLNGDKIVIIGTGPCGLGAAWRLNEVGHTNWIAIDRFEHAGGLGSSVVDKNGFTWDMGGHVIFSHFEYFTKLLDLVVSDWEEHVREAWVWMRNTWIPYPLQNNIWRLPKDDLAKCLEGLLEVERMKGKQKKPENFREWLLNGFGEGLMEVFLDPYNKKVWAYPPEELNTEWMGERVATVDFKKVMTNVVYSRDSLGWGPNATFRFPTYGGTGSIWKAVHAHLPKERFRMKTEVVSINVSDPDNKYLTVEGGEKIPFDKMISTVALDDMCKMITGLPSISKAELLDRAKKFRYSSSHIIGLGLKGETPDDLKTKCWMYFPEDDCPFYRATVFSNYSPNHVPIKGKQWSLMLEVSESPQKPVPKCEEEIIKLTIQGCINTKMIQSEDEIVSTFHVRLEHGYPTPFKGRDELCKPIFDALEEVGISSRGRFGAWKYEVSNQDHSLAQGVEAADHHVFGTPEMCFSYPEIVNKGKDGKSTRLLTKRTPFGLVSRSSS